jgi:hypothetical protein
MRASILRAEAAFGHGDETGYHITLFKGGGYPITVWLDAKLR